MSTRNASADTKLYRILVIDSGVVSNRTDILLSELSRFRPQREFEVVYLPRKFFDSESARTFWQRLKNLFWNLGWLTTVVVAASRADAVHVGPISDRLLSLAVTLQRLLGVKLIYDVYASSVLTNDEAAEFGSHAPSPAKTESRERHGMRKADRLIFLQRAEMRAVSKRLDIAFDSSKIRVVPLAIIDPTIKTGTSERPPSGRLRIAWWALFSPLHGVEIVLDAMQLLKAQHNLDQRILLTMYGQGTHRFDVPGAIAARGLEEMVVFDTEKTLANGKLTDALIHETDLALGQFGSSTKARVVVPNKAVEAFTYRLPLLTARNEAYKEFMDEQSAYFVDSAPEAIADAVVAALEAPCDRAKRAARGRAVYESQFTVAAYRQRMLEIYRELRDDHG